MVNNDGELAIDLAEGDDMEDLLQAEMDKQGQFMSLSHPPRDIHPLRDVIIGSYRFTPCEI